jgi:hypothetical protein
LKSDTYVVGPKFILYLSATFVYWLLSFISSGIDPLSALFFTNLFCLFGSTALIYAIASKSGFAKSRASYALLPVLLLSLPSTYYLVYYPSYPHVILFFLLGSIYLVMRAYDGKASRSVALLFLSGLLLGFTTGVGSQAPLCIFVGLVFAGLVAFPRRLLIRTLLFLCLGIVAAILLSELAYQVNGESFIKLTWLHAHDNVYANHLKVPFPFIPLVYFRIIYALTPATLLIFLGGTCLYTLWRRNVSHEVRSLFLSLVTLLVVISFLPTTPLYRIVFPFFVLMQVCVFLMVLSVKKTAVRNVIIAVLLLETLLTLPSALFIRMEQSEFNSPVSLFENEIYIVRYFGYDK